jgi:hypothetical protein
MQQLNTLENFERKEGEDTEVVDVLEGEIWVIVGTVEASVKASGEEDEEGGEKEKNA